MSDNPIGREESREARGYVDPILPADTGTAFRPAPFHIYTPGPGVFEIRDRAGDIVTTYPTEMTARHRLDELNAGDFVGGPASTMPFNPFPTLVLRPAEPEVGTVLGFTRQFTEGGQVYSFAAIRATSKHNGWYLTGPQYSGKAYTWDALLDFVGGPAEWARIGVVAGWAPLGDPR